MGAGPVDFVCPLCKSGNTMKRGRGRGEDPAQIIHCRDCGKYSTIPLKLSSEPELAKTISEVRQIESAMRYVVTSAQNNTPLTPTWSTLVRYAKEHGAQLIVIPVRYRNPTLPTIEVLAGLAEEEEELIWWPEEVRPFLVDNLIKIHPLLWVMSHVRIAATATNPLSGLDGMSKGSSALFGHGQCQMRTVATPQNSLPKILMTTGSVSVNNYSISKVGAKADFHHTQAAVVVECDGPRRFHMRRVTANSDHTFQDLDRVYRPDRPSKKGPRAAALVLGDEHVQFIDPKAKAAVFEGPDCIVAKLRPRKLIRHDVFDGFSISHHDRKDPIISFVKHKTGTNSVEAELELTRKHIDETCPKDTENVMVSSNHHDHLAQWLKEVDPKTEPWNAVLYHRLMADVLESARMGVGGPEYDDPFKLWMTPRLTSPTTFLGPDESYVVEGVELMLHGHQAANGTRGSLVGFSKFGIRTVVGHSHTPGEEKGCHQVGTLGWLKRHYARGGGSSWMQTVCAIYEGVAGHGGKKQLIHVIDGAWCGGR